MTDVAEILERRRRIDAEVRERGAENAAYLTTLPWFAVSDPDEPTPIWSQLVAERHYFCDHAPPEHPATPQRDSRGRFTRSTR